MLAAIAQAVAVVGLSIAAAGPLTDAAAAELPGDPVYVHPSAAEVVSDEQAAELRDRVRSIEPPIFIAVLPPEAVGEVGGNPSDLPSAIGEAVGIRGTYAVIAGNSFRVASNALPNGVAEDRASAALRSSNTAFGVLEAWLDRMQGTEEKGSSLLPLVLVLAAVGTGIFLLARSTRKRQAVDRVALQAAQQDLQAELAVLADDVLRLEPEVVTVPAARQDYDAAVSRYRWLEAAIPSIDSPDDPPRIARAMGEARYAMARAQAIVRGQEPPPLPPELSAPGRYGEPAVEVDEEDEYRRPRYAGQRGVDDGGWYGGGFFGGNGLFTGLLLGSMLGGGGWGGGWGGGDGGSSDGSDGGGFGGGFGDAGGGDFGGFGDAGGGDFGD